MENNCKLCGGKYDFRMVKIDEYLNMTGIAFSGSIRQVNNDNRFRFCPKCGRELTKEDFGGVDFNDKLDMREKIKEYIDKLCAKIKRCETEIVNTKDVNYEARMMARLDALTEARNDLLERLNEIDGINYKRISK